MKGFSKRAALFAVVSAVALLAIDYALGGFASEDGDWSRSVFKDIALSIPAGVFILFVVNFVRWVGLEDPEKALASS